MSDIERRLRDLGEDVARDAGYRAAPAARIVRRARLRRALTVATPGLAVVLLAGVALPRVDWPGGSTSESSLAMLSGAVDATQDQGSARVEVEFEFDMGSEVVSSRSTGVIDFDTGRARLQVTYTGDGSERVVEVVTDGTRMFERPVDSPDAKWYEFELRPGATSGPPDLRPAEFLGYVESVASEVTRVGAEVRDGVPVTRYRAVLDPAKVTEASGEEVPEGLEVETDPMDVWVDEQGRVREATFGGTTTVDDFKQTMRGSIRFFDFGTPADIELPGPDEMTDEPPPSWDGPGGEIIGSDSGADAGAITMIMGKERVDAPYIEVDTDRSFIEVCVLSAQPVTGAKLVHDPSGRQVFAFEPVHSDGHYEGPLPVACVEQAFLPRDVQALVEDPTEFTLSVTRKDGSTEIVRLTTTASSVGG